METNNQNCDNISLSKMQEEVSSWAIYNFGEQDAYRPLLGIFEELGEYAFARDSLSPAGMRDAIGDMGIYILHYCSIRGWSSAELWDCRVGPTGPDMEVVRSLSHSHLKGAQNIRGGSAKHDFWLKQELSKLFWRLDQASIDLGGDFLRIIHNTWEIVKQRDWKKNPNNADEVVEESLCADTMTEPVLEEARSIDTSRPEDAPEATRTIEDVDVLQSWLDSRARKDSRSLRECADSLRNVLKSKNPSRAPFTVEEVEYAKCIKELNEVLTPGTSGPEACRDEVSDD